MKFCLCETKLPTDNVGDGLQHQLSFLNVLETIRDPKNSVATFVAAIEGVSPA